MSDSTKPITPEDKDECWCDWHDLALTHKHSRADWRAKGG